MTTEVIIRANSGRAVEVQLVSMSGNSLARVEPGDQRSFYVDEQQDLLIHEIQPDAGAPVACDEPILKYFAWAHLPDRLQAVSRPFGMLAARIVATTLRGPERSACLRKLLEAKDCAVRASLEG